MEAAAMDPDARFSVEDFLLDFNLDVDDREDDDLKANKTLSSMDFSDPNSFDPAQNSLLPDGGAEEELEWLNGTFPEVETTCLSGILPLNSGILLNHQSPVSVLENSSNTSNNSTITNCCGGSVAVPVCYPVKPRSKRRRRKRRDLPTQQCWWWSQENLKSVRQELPAATSGGSKIGRRCLHCQTDKTPQWRAGPMGPKTLCNACGVRYKSGRLVPEYRPASSPTFSSVLHSNSHRKIVEMRKKRQVGGGGMMVLNKDCEYRVG